MLDTQVLLLNNNFEPITICTARRAIIMVWAGKAEIVEATGHYIHSVSMAFSIPSIVRMLRYIQSKHRWKIQLSKQNILKRDHRVCQYCGTSEGYMTVDHVIPRSLGGGETWENLVCACPSCNNRKGDRTLDQAGMKLMHKPMKPSIRSFMLGKGPIISSWQPYLRM